MVKLEWKTQRKIWLNECLEVLNYFWFAQTYVSWILTLLCYWSLTFIKEACGILIYMCVKESLIRIPKNIARRNYGNKTIQEEKAWMHNSFPVFYRNESFVMIINKTISDDPHAFISPESQKLFCLAKPVRRGQAQATVDSRQVTQIEDVVEFGWCWR